jgi:uncharacterized coiled-coil protein SlyX
MAGMLDMYKAKKKRAVDPNAPPRPTLLGHEKVIKDAKATIEQQQYQIHQLTQRLEALERKLAYQTTYLSALHNRLGNKK